MISIIIINSLTEMQLKEEKEQNLLTNQLNLFINQNVVEKHYICLNWPIPLAVGDFSCSNSHRRSWFRWWWWGGGWGL